MPHGMTNRDTAMFGSGKPAWHRHPNSIVVEGNPEGEEALNLSGLGWLVEKQPIFGKAGRSLIQLPSHFVTVRKDIPLDDPARFLGVVQQRYQVIQNAEVIKIADAIIGEGNARFETLGSIWGGRVCYATILLPGDVRVQDDKITKFIVLKWAHDGSCGVEGCITPVRAVCQNTVRAAFASAEATVSIRHTEGAMTRIDEARRVLRIANESFDATGEMFNRMSQSAIDARFVDAYLKALIPDPVRKPDAKRTSSRSSNMRNEIAELFNGKQKGASMRAIQGTAWGLFNATTEYIDHKQTSRAVNGRDEYEAKFDSVMWGAGARLRQNAFGLLSRQLGLVAS